MLQENQITLTGTLEISGGQQASDAKESTHQYLA